MYPLLLDKNPDFPDLENNFFLYEVVAIGGKINVEWLLKAYSSGIFPWYENDEEKLWWFPHTRAVMRPNDVRVHKSMRPYFNQKKFRLKIDTAFEEVITLCAEVKRTYDPEPGTWITDEMKKGYIDLHKAGYAHSFEVWENGDLVGGLYGVAIGKIFSGESMFALKKNASKFAFIAMNKILGGAGFNYIDCQYPSEHLFFMGCKTMPGKDYLKIIKQNQKYPTLKGKWTEIFKDLIAEFI